MKFLLTGFGVALISSFVSLIVWGFEKAYMLPGIIGLLFLGVAILLSGALLCGPELLANLSTQSREDRTRRNDEVFSVLLMAFPCLGVAGVFYILFN
ncbi:MAG: DUF5316 family protein [Lysinibacillus sp.]